MKITKYLTGALVCLLLLSCGGSGKNRKREPSRESKREKVEQKESAKEVDSETAADEEQQRNNGNYKAPSNRKKGNSRLRRKGNGKPVPVPEEESIKSNEVNISRVEERVRLEQKIWEASTANNTELFNKLKEEANALAKKMSQKELDEAYKRIKNLKKMQ